MKNIHKITYMNQTQAFLNSSGFHLAIIILNPNQTKIHITSTSTMEKTSALNQASKLDIMLPQSCPVDE
jgi:hypothetical protein